MTESSVSTRSGGGVAVILWLTSAVLFVLQVCGVIHVSWWLVFAPILLSFALGIAVMVIVLIGFLIALAVAGIGSRNKKNSGIVTPYRPRR